MHTKWSHPGRIFLSGTGYVSFFPLSSVISRTDYWPLKLRPTLWLFHKSEGLQAKWTARDYDYSTYLPNFPPKANKWPSFFYMFLNSPLTSPFNLFTAQCLRRENQRYSPVSKMIGKTAHPSSSDLHTHLSYKRWWKGNATSNLVMDILWMIHQK